MVPDGDVPRVHQAVGPHQRAAHPGQELHVHRPQLYCILLEFIFVDYDVAQYSGRKYIYLSEVNDYGGTNKVMGIIYLAMAGVVLLVIVIFTGMYLVRVKGNESFYDPDYIEW